MTHFLPEASSCLKKASLGVRSNAGNTGRPLMIGRGDHATGVNGLPFLQHDDIVEVKKVECAGGFQSSDISI